ncbi:MAG TPA: CYTH domain-containing protein [Candidatus Paceibacterota bacterium]|nr:CYTH domain-containing protein [Candidatus Paceibacterota bacterium]
MAGSYEVEVKTLLGSKEAADALLARMRALDPELAPPATSKQLNHYFEGGDPKALVTNLTARHAIDAEHAARMQTMAERGDKLSVRTRETEGGVRFVMKASVGSDSSANGVMRMEVDLPIPDATLDSLDKEVERAGYRYQAKWSRERQEYQLGDVAVCLDKNAGYGYLAEFERVVEEEGAVSAARAKLKLLMEELGVEELPQDRLERMFSYYNAHWSEYYGTDKIFTIE